MALNRFHQMSGIEKSALVLNELGDEVRAEIFKEIPESDVKLLLNAMSQVEASRSVVDGVLDLFYGQIVDVHPYKFCKDHQNNIEKKRSQESKSPFHLFEKMCPQKLSEFLLKEHPQTIALILAYLSPSKKNEILTLFSDEVRVNVVYRIAKLKFISITVLSQLDSFIQEQLLSEIQNNISNFEDLIKMDDHLIQSLLKQVDNHNLTCALKLASEEIKEKIFKNISRSASELLQCDLESIGPIRLSDVEFAQKEILQIAKRLRSDGQIIGAIKYACH